MGHKTGLDLLQMKKITLPASIRTLGLSPLLSGHYTD
jgi:hypothetical protein